MGEDVLVRRLTDYVERVDTDMVRGFDCAVCELQLRQAVTPVWILS